MGHWLPKEALGPCLDSQVAGNHRPLYPKVDPYWFTVAHNYEPLALQVYHEVWGPRVHWKWASVSPKVPARRPRIWTLRGGFRCIIKSCHILLYDCYYIILYHIISYYIILYYIILYYIILYYIMLYYTILYDIILYYMLLYYIILFILYYIISYYIILYYIILYYIILYYIILYYIIL